MDYQLWTHLQSQLSRTLLCLMLLTVLSCLAQDAVLPTIDPILSVNMTTDSGMDDTLIKLLLDMHNMYRKEERDAANMNKLEWSRYLELEAAKWVKGCEFLHQTDPLWGENMYRSTSKTTADQFIDNGLSAWHLEHYNIMASADQMIDCCTENKMTCCHYTQMVWASSEYVGCGMTKCPFLKGENSRSDYKNAVYMACYYYPAGNVKDQQPFIRSSAGQCTNCSATNPDCEGGLCYFDTSRCVN